MPVYDYRCDSCGHAFHARQGFDDPPVAKCPRCGARPRKLVSMPAIVFKGSGWHLTDYRAKEAGASSDGASKDTKKDTKKDAAPKDDASKKGGAPTKSDASSGPNSP